MPRTLLLALISLALSLTIAVGLGSVAAMHPRSFWGWLSSAIAAFGRAACLLVGRGIGPRLRGGPALAAGWRLFRLERPCAARGRRGAFNSADAVARVARVNGGGVEGRINPHGPAFGIRQGRITFVYALKSALPLLTVIGVDVGYLLGGVIVAEVVFDFPGIGGSP